MNQPSGPTDPAGDDPGQVDFVHQGQLLLRAEDFSEAARICRLGLLSDPTNVEGRLVLAAALMALGRHDEVLPEMRAALEVDPGNATAHLLKGEALLNKRDFDQAREALLVAQDLDPLSEVVPRLLEQLDEVVEYGEEAVSRVRTDTKVYPAPRAQEIEVTREIQDVPSAVESLRQLELEESLEEDSTDLEVEEDDPDVVVVDEEYLEALQGAESEWEEDPGEFTRVDGAPMEPDPLPLSSVPPEELPSSPLDLDSAPPDLMVPEGDEEDEDERYITAPYIPPSYLEQMRRDAAKHNDVLSEEETLTESPQDVLDATENGPEASPFDSLPVQRAAADTPADGILADDDLNRLVDEIQQNLTPVEGLLPSEPTRAQHMGVLFADEEPEESVPGLTDDLDQEEYEEYAPTETVDEPPVYGKETVDEASGLAPVDSEPRSPPGLATGGDELPDAMFPADEVDQWEPEPALDLEAYGPGAAAREQVPGLVESDYPDELREDGSEVEVLHAEPTSVLPGEGMPQDLAASMQELDEAPQEDETALGIEQVQQATDAPTAAPQRSLEPEQALDQYEDQAQDHDDEYLDDATWDSGSAAGEAEDEFEHDEPTMADDQGVAAGWREAVSGAWDGMPDEPEGADSVEQLPGLSAPEISVVSQDIVDVDDLTLARAEDFPTLTPAPELLDEAEHDAGGPGTMELPPQDMDGTPLADGELPLPAAEEPTPWGSGPARVPGESTKAVEIDSVEREIERLDQRSEPPELYPPDDSVETVTGDPETEEDEYVDLDADLETGFHRPEDGSYGAQPAELGEGASFDDPELEEEQQTGYLQPPELQTPVEQGWEEAPPAEAYAAEAYDGPAQEPAFDDLSEPSIPDMEDVAFVPEADLEQSEAAISLESSDYAEVSQIEEIEEIEEFEEISSMDEISVEMLPDEEEMPPLPSDAQDLSELDASAWEVDEEPPDQLEPFEEPSAAPVENEEPTRVKFDLGEDELRQLGLGEPEFPPADQGPAPENLDDFPAADGAAGYGGEEFQEPYGAPAPEPPYGGQPGGDSFGEPAADEHFGAQPVDDPYASQHPDAFGGGDSYQEPYDDQLDDGPGGEDYVDPFDAGGSGGDEFQQAYNEQVDAGYIPPVAPPAQFPAAASPHFTYPPEGPSADPALPYTDTSPQGDLEQGAAEEPYQPGWSQPPQRTADLSQLEPGANPFAPQAPAEPNFTGEIGDQPMRRSLAELDPPLRRETTAPTGEGADDFFNKRSPTYSKEVKSRKPMPLVVEHTTTSLLDMIKGKPGSKRWLMLIVGTIGVVALAVGIGRVVRYFRVGDQIEGKRARAQQRIQRGNYPDYLAAAQSFADIAKQRTDDKEVLWALTRVRAAIPIEFGDPSPQDHRKAGEAGADLPDRHAAEVYMALFAGSLKRANDTLTRAQRTHTASPLLLYLEGRVRVLEGDGESAQQALEKAHKKAPKDAQVLRWLAASLAMQGKSKEALEAYGKALKVNPDHVATLVARARLQLKLRKNLSDARQDLDSVLSGKRGAVASKGQRGWAYLVSSRLALATGNGALANTHMAKARSHKPGRDVLFMDELALALLETSQLSEAEQVVRESRRLIKGRPHHALRMAQVRLEQGNASAALDELKQADKLDIPAVGLLRARIYERLGRLFDASREVDKVLDSSANLLEAKVVKARILAAQGRVGLAEGQLRGLIAKNPRNAWLLTALGEIFLRAGRIDEARSRFDEAIRVDRTAMQAQLLLAQVFASQGNYSEARRRLADANKSSAGNLAVVKQLAALELDLGNRAKARSEYQRILTRAPNDAQARLGMARVLTLLHEYTSADAEIRAAEAQQAGATALALAKGRVALSRGKAGQAAGLLAQVTSKEAKNIEAWDLLVQAHLMNNDESAAKSVVDKLNSKLAGSTVAQVAAGRVALNAGNSRRAIRAFSSASLAAAKPGAAAPVRRAQVQVLLGRGYQDSGRVNDALGQYAEASKLCPACPEPPYRMGLALDENGRVKAAIGALRKAKRLDPKMLEVYYDLGQVLERDGQRGAARKAYEKYLSLKPPKELAEAAREALRNLR